MEFSYKLTEDDFIRGVRLERKALPIEPQDALFWMSIMGGLMILLPQFGRRSSGT